MELFVIYAVQRTREMRPLRCYVIYCSDICKKQYPVTVHVPNFEYLTGCREFKRCEESKRTLKNPFASHLAVFDTTLNFLRITDQ